MPRKSNEYSIGEALNQFLEEHRLLEQALIRRVIAEWAEVVGRPIAEQTKAVWWENGVFHVELSSPAWKHELQYSRSKLLARINEWAGRAVAKDVQLR